MKQLHHPPVYFLLTTTLGVLIGHWVLLPFQFPSSIQLFSIFCFLWGSTMGVLSVILFKLQYTNVLPFSEATNLVQTGFYQFTRNPMYLGLLFIQTSILTAFTQPLTLIVIPLFWAILHFCFVLREEALLLEKFGDNYQRFLGKTRRWI